MTARASSIIFLQPACAPPRLSHQLLRHHELLFPQSRVTIHTRRSYASKPRASGPQKSPTVLLPVLKYRDRNEVTKAKPQHTAMDIELYGDGINPPLTTIPPPLNLPERRRGTSGLAYWWSVGRTYGKFYWVGVKAIWANYKKAKGLLRTIRANNSDPANHPMGRHIGVAWPPRRMFGLRPPPLLLDIEAAMWGVKITRSQFQLLVRERADVKKLPLFAVMVAAFGEWLPLIVPFIPGRVPKVCSIPKQVDGMRKTVEERRSQSFRSGVQQPDQKTLLDKTQELVEKVKEMERQFHKAGLSDDPEAALELEEAVSADFMALWVQPATWLAMQMAQSLSRQQVEHVSASLGLHGKTWDRLGLTGDTMFAQVAHPVLQFRVIKHLQYLNIDDQLIMQNGPHAVQMISRQELKIACEERGIDVLGRKEETLRTELGKWMDNRRKDKGYGAEVVSMLFTR